MAMLNNQLNTKKKKEKLSEPCQGRNNLYLRRGAQNASAPL
jgi:hypothetical protein